jgi:hypothetical protein
MRALRCNEHVGQPGGHALMQHDRLAKCASLGSVAQCKCNVVLHGTAEQGRHVQGDVGEPCLRGRVILRVTLIDRGEWGGAQCAVAAPLLERKSAKHNEAAAACVSVPMGRVDEGETAGVRCEHQWCNGRAILIVQMPERGGVMPMETERAMGTSGLLGDGAFAALIERHARTNRLVALATHASGRGWRGMLGQTEASFLAQYQLVARKLITKVAQDAHIALSELDHILPPHLNQPAWRRLVQSMRLPPERLFAHNFSRIAHVTVSDPFINLADSGPLAPGAPLVLYAQGVGGFSTAALLIH